MSEAGSVILQGDSSRRVTVPMPQSLQELQFHAHRHFAGGSRLFHHGAAPLKHPKHIGKVKDGDVVVVEALPTAPPKAPELTTHQADYIKHALEARSPLKPIRTPEPGAKFDSITSYTADYVKHPGGPRKPCMPQKSGWTSGRPDGTTGKSTYTTHFPWHSSEPRRAVHPQAAVSVNTAPFDAATSYNLDYIKHQLQPRSPMVPQKPQGDPAPFEGSTTYNNDFQKFPQARTIPARPHSTTLGPDGAPFAGSSEYKREYVELKAETRPLVHLEPEIRRFPRPGSTPARGRVRN